jgi:hypothetical protein
MLTFSLCGQVEVQANRNPRAFFLVYVAFKNKFSGFHGFTSGDSVTQSQFMPRPSWWSADTKPYFSMIHTALGTGMRLSEFRGLAWDDVGLDAKLLRVRRPADRYNVITETLKTESSRRTITLSPVLVEMLKAHHQHLLEEKMRLCPI